MHNESLLLAVPDGHPLTRVTNPNVQDVANYDVVTYDHFGAHYFFELIVSVFRDAGARPRYTQYVSQVSSVLALVSGGLGVAFVPEGIKVLKLPNMRFIRVSGVRANCVELYCVWKTGNENPALTSLLALAASEGFLPSFP